MPNYKYYVDNTFKRGINAFRKDKKARQLSQEAIEGIVSNPEGGEPYTGNMEGLIKWKYGKKPAYRIIYALKPCCHLKDCVYGINDPQHEDCSGYIHFAFIGTRESMDRIYMSSRKFFDNYLKERGL